MAKRFDQLSQAAKAVVLDLFCRANGYGVDAMGNPVATAETQGQFTTRMCQEWIVKVALQQRAADAENAAGATASSDADLV